MGKTGVINRDFTGEENNVYHDVIRLFKIYRAVNWRMQIKVNQVKHRIREEYGTDLDEFLDSIYQAGMDINQDLDDMKQRIEVINRSNKFLKLIDEAVELMRNFHPQGERYYWVLYYSYMSARKAENIDEILDLLEPHFPKITRIHRATYFRWREQAFQAVSSILWGWERGISTCLWVLIDLMNQKKIEQHFLASKEEYPIRIIFVGDGEIYDILYIAPEDIELTNQLFVRKKIDGCGHVVVVEEPESIPKIRVPDVIGYCTVKGDGEVEYYQKESQ